MSKHSRDFKINFDSILAALSVKSSEFIDSAKIKLDISSLKKQRDEEYREIGKLVYKMYERGRVDQKKLFERCSSIDKIEKLISFKKKEVERVHKSAHKDYKRALEGKNDRFRRERAEMERYERHSGGSSFELEYHDDKDFVETDDYDIKPID